jgi:hypothetical protein
MNNQFWCVENICTFYLSVALFVQEKKETSLHHDSQFQENFIITDILGSYVLFTCLEIMKAAVKVNHICWLHHNTSNKTSKYFWFLK